MIKKLIQVIAFLFPSPINIWLHRLAGAKIGKHTSIHPGVLILAKKMEIGSSTKIRFGTFIKARSLKVGSKTLLGYFLLVKGVSDFTVGDACVIGPRTMINCDCPVTLEYYSGVGPGCILFAHGSFLPVSEGYRTTFGPITIKSKAWVTMHCTVGPGVTVGEGTNVMPGTTLIESVGANRLVSGDPAKLINIPLFKNFQKAKNLDMLAEEIIHEYRNWSNEFNDTNWQNVNGALHVNHKKRSFSVSTNGDADVVLLTEKGAKRDGMYFNLVDLKTDHARHPVKLEFESYMRLYYGLTFLEDA